MAVTPSTNLKLLSVPIAIDNMNQLTFTNAQSQYNYFNSLPYDELLDNITYQRYDSVIRYPGHIDTLRKYNYCMYQNENYGNKWFYAFIVGMEYANDNVTLISIKTDVFQTWQFDLKYNDCFVEREHVNDDTIGLHTFPENLETGEYIVNSTYVDSNLDNFLQDTSYIIGASVDISSSKETKPFNGGGIYNGVYSGVKYFVWKATPEGIVGAINTKLQELAESGQVDTITGVFIVPSFLAPSIASGVEVENSTEPYTYNFNVPKTYGLNGYIPKNNKLYCHPYCYLIGSNMAGTDNIYRYEDFSDTNCNFKVYGVLAPGGSIRCVPINYKGSVENDMEGITLGKYPICNYAVDMYTNWLTQNSINIGGVSVSSDDISIGQGASNGILNLIENIFKGDILGGVSDVVNDSANITNALIQQKQHTLIPPSVRGNTNCGDVMSASNKNNFRFYRMSIKREYAELIDNYFSMYGYKVSTLKIPNITGRQNWNYVQTIGANIIADIPQEDLEEIKNIFNKGVTLWHNPSTFLDYNQSNNIV